MTRVLIAGGGPVGMTLARTLASFGVRCLLVERNPTTTRHPKMDITNGRSMELFRRLGLVDKLRAVAVPEENNFDISWITSLTGRELHRFRYPSVVEKRAEILATQRRHPAARARHARQPGHDRAGAARRHPERSAGRRALGRGLRGFPAGRRTASPRRCAPWRPARPRQVRCDFLAGCDGGSSIVRDKLGIGLEGRAAVAHRYMVHFRSDARDILQAFGIAWHYQTATRHDDRAGRQGDLDPADAAAARRRSCQPRSATPCSKRWVGRPSFARQILVANPWFTHLLLAERYQGGRVFLAGDCRAPVHPDRRLRHEHRHRRRRRSRLEARRGAQGLRRPGPARLLRSGAPAGRLSQSARLGAPHRRAPQDRRALPERYAIPTRWAAPSPRWAMPRTRAGASSSAIATTASRPIPSIYEPTTAPGARLPSTFLRDGRALYDRLGPWFTLLRLRRRRSVASDRCRAGAARDRDRRRSGVAPIYEAKLVLVRPDTHVAWRGNACADGRAVWQGRRTLGRRDDDRRKLQFEECSARLPRR